MRERHERKERAREFSMFECHHRMCEFVRWIQLYKRKNRFYSLQCTSVLHRRAFALSVNHLAVHSTLSLLSFFRAFFKKRVFSPSFSFLQIYSTITAPNGIGRSVRHSAFRLSDSLWVHISKFIVE